jgi:DNA-binding response OmpR family regulator
VLLVREIKATRRITIVHFLDDSNFNEFSQIVVVDQAVKELKAGGVRITPQRYAILEYLIEYRNHPTADEIFRSHILCKLHDSAACS